MSNASEPLTPEEARQYEAPVRRKLWLGLAGFAALIVLLIMIGMEARLRTTLLEPQPSGILDAEMTEVMRDMAPLPDRLRRLALYTADDAHGRSYYHVELRDGDAEVFYHAAFRAATTEVIPTGPRQGEAVNLDVELRVADDNAVSGLYREDRAIHAERYQALIAGVVRQALVAHQTEAVMGDPPAPSADVEWTREELRRSWQWIMD